MVTWQATVFINSTRSCVLRHTWPPSSTCGSTRWMTSSRPRGKSDSALAQRRSATDNPRGPSPTIASSSFSVNTGGPDLCDAAHATAESGRRRSQPVRAECLTWSWWFPIELGERIARGEVFLGGHRGDDEVLVLLAQVALVVICAAAASATCADLASIGFRHKRIHDPTNGVTARSGLLGCQDGAVWIVTARRTRSSISSSSAIVGASMKKVTARSSELRMGPSSAPRAS